jgi:hypothetical protein
MLPNISAAVSSAASWENGCRCRQRGAKPIPTRLLYDWTICNLGAPPGGQ